jgi:hypothetical protein
VGSDGGRPRQLLVPPREQAARLPLGPGVYRFRDAAGQEYEVWIRLSTSADAPGVTVTHRPRTSDPARYFGPYLGGRKTRDAVSGLSRVLPLGHATDRAAGTEGELARARGASPGARADLARTVTAVLDRDPAAVAALRAELIRRRRPPDRRTGRSAPGLLNSGGALGEAVPVARVIPHDRLDPVGTLGGRLGELDASFGQRVVIGLAV